MSGGERKKRISRGGWEEAKDEFYQESYPTDADLEVLERDPKKIATLLPSKQTRATTVKRSYAKDIKSKNTAKKRIKQNQQGTVRRQSIVQDNYVAMMPDLSENLSNEESTWEEIMQIKAMPVNMAYKKELKARLQRATKLRLQGYEQFKWQRRKLWQKLKIQWKEMYTKLGVWNNSFKKIEGHFGTGVVTYFQFIKWLLFLNFFIFLFIFLFVILPTLTLEKVNGSGNNTVCDGNVSVLCCSEEYLQTYNSTNFFIVDIIQGSGWMEHSVMFYGSYDSSVLTTPNNAIFYNLPFAYVIIIILIFLISLAAIVKSAASGFKERLIEGEGQFYQYCNLIFGGWDFCIHNEKSADIKHKALFNEIRSHLIVERIEEERQHRSQEEKTKLIFIRTVVNSLVLLILMGSGTLIYFVFTFSKELLDTRTDGGDVIYSLQNLLLEYLPSIAIIGLNIIVPILFTYLVGFEHYSPLFIIRITLMRTVFLRLASLVVLLMSLYSLVSCRPKDEVVEECSSSKCKAPLCWETYFGQQFYKLMILDFVTHFLLTFFFNFPRMLIAKHFNSKFAKFIGEQEFELPKHVLDVVYTQTLCWLGTFYSPLLPAMAFVLLFFVFYIKKFTCLVNSKPASTVHLASRSKSLFMAVLLVSFILAIIPVSLSIAEVMPSISCGPFRGYGSVWEVVMLAFQMLPHWFQSIIFYFATAGFAIPAFIVLTLSLYYFYAVSAANKHMVMVLKNQLVLEGHDKQFLLNRLSAFIKQQQEHSRKQARNVTANIDVNSTTDNSTAS